MCLAAGMQSDPPSFLAVGAEGCFAVDRASRGMKLTAHGRLVPGFKTGETCFYSPHLSSWGRCLVKRRDLTCALPAFGCFFRDFSDPAMLWDDA